MRTTRKYDETSADFKKSTKFCKKMRDDFWKNMRASWTEELKEATKKRDGVA